MTDRFKFRAWDKINNSMLHEVSVGTILLFDGTTEAFSKDCEFMQRTGLADCEGVNVYEGDVVKVYGYVESFLNKETVVYSDKEGAFGFKDSWGGRHNIGDVKTKVIGNIREHPYLLDSTNTND